MFRMFQRGPSLPSVAVIYFRGQLGSPGITFASAKLYIDKAFSQKSLAAVCLVINSPGGSPVQSSLIADYLRHRATSRSVPLYAFVEEIAASGGYLLASAADKIFVNRFSMVGSIGAVISSVYVGPLLTKLGVIPRVYTAGERKGGMNPLVEMNEEEERDIENLLKYTHQTFIEHIKERRGDMLKSAHYQEIFSGAAWGGEQAVEYGLVDGTYTVLENTIAELTKNTSYHLVTIKSKAENPLSGFLEDFLPALDSMLQWAMPSLAGRTRPDTRSADIV